MPIEPPTPAPLPDTAPDGPTGGCLCGALRYRLARVPTDVGHCHCRICQKAHGAAVVTWATVPRAELSLSGAAPVWWRSSAAARRGRCPTCGTPLFFAFDADAADRRADLPADATATIDVAVATLDDPDAVTPTRNIWVDSRRAFLRGFDASLPDHRDEGPDPV